MHFFVGIFHVLVNMNFFLKSISKVFLYHLCQIVVSSVYCLAGSLFYKFGVILIFV